MVNLPLIKNGVSIDIKSNCIKFQSFIICIYAYIPCKAVAADSTRAPMIYILII